MKFGARNQLRGKVREIKKGKLMCQVKIELNPRGSHVISLHA
jgi:molybdopterin-binding protein